MSSPLSLFSPHVPIAPASGTATPGVATGLPSGTTPVGLPGAQSESLDGEGNFLTAFFHLMQANVATETALQNPPQLDDAAGITADSDTALVFEFTGDGDLQLDGLLEDLTAAENSPDSVLPAPAEAPLDMDLAVPLAMPVVADITLQEHTAALSPPWMPMDTGDGIPADQLILPPIAAEEVVNPALPELATESPFENPVLIFNASAPAPAAMPAGIMTASEPNSSKRLDLTQWLSGANLATEVDVAEGTAAASNTLSLTDALPIKENANVLLKNALFARALPKAEGLIRLEAELTPPAINEATAKPSTGSAPAPWVADITNTGRITVPISLSFGHPQWSEALAERAGWLAHQRIQSADMQLDPPELGPLQVKISMHQDQAVVSFVSANPQVRDLLDQNLVRLRELLQEQGIQLMDAGVSDHQQQSDEGTRSLAGDFMAASDDEGATITPDTVETHHQTNLAWGVDDFV